MSFAGLDADPRVLIVQYEDTVLEAERAFERVLGFLDAPYDPVVVEDVFATSVSRHSPPTIDDAIRHACDRLQVRLDAQYAAAVGWTD